MRKHCLIGILSIVGLLPCGVTASVQADTAAVMLRDLTVKATKAEKRIVSTAPMHVINEDQIRRLGVTSVSDAILRLPGVTLRDYGGAGGLKTVSVRGFGAGHMGVIYDGIPLSDIQSGQIDLSRYSTDNLKSLTMVVGDNDDIFMPARLAANAATFSISSMPSPADFELNAKLRVGAWQYVNPFLRIGTALSDKFSFNFVGDFTHANNDYPFKLQNGAMTTTERRNNSRMNSGHGEVNTSWRPTNSTFLTSKIYYYNNARRLPGPVIYYNDQNHERLHEENVFAQSQLRKYFSSKLSLLANVKFNYATSKYEDEKGIYPGGMLKQYYWQREYYASGALLYVPMRQWAFDYSFDYFFNNLNSNLRTDTRPYRHSVLQSATGRWRSNHLTATARVLYSVYVNGAKEGAGARDVNRFSPSLSVSVQPWLNRTLYLRASYKNIFRMPTFNESYFDHYGSQNLLPESTNQINVGFTWAMPATKAISSLSFTADFYYNHIKDMIVAVPYNMFVWNIVNLSKARSIGLDITATSTFVLHKGHDLMLTGNYSFQRAEPRTDRQSSEWGKQVAYIPRHSGNAAIAYENPWCNISLHATAVSERFTTNNNIKDTRIAPYTEFGATLWREIRISSRILELRLDLLNLFNKQYCIVARYPMPGRAWQATISYTI